MKVWAENTLTSTICHVASAYLVFVAIDEEGRRMKVPELIPETADEVRRYEGALRGARTGRPRRRGAKQARMASRGAGESQAEAPEKNRLKRFEHKFQEKEQENMAHSPAMPAPVALPGVSKIIAVGSGKGGVGKTTVAVNLAIALSRLGQRVGLIDADIYGPNVPLMMGSTQQPKVGPGNRLSPT